MKTLMIFAAVVLSTLVFAGCGGGSPTGMTSSRSVTPQVVVANPGAGSPAGSCSGVQCSVTIPAGGSGYFLYQFSSDQPVTISASIGGVLDPTLELPVTTFTNTLVCFSWAATAGSAGIGTFSLDAAAQALGAVAISASTTPGCGTSADQNVIFDDAVPGFNDHAPGGFARLRP